MAYHYCGEGACGMHCIKSPDIKILNSALPVNEVNCCALTECNGDNSVLVNPPSSSAGEEGIPIALSKRGKSIKVRLVDFFHRVLGLIHASRLPLAPARLCVPGAPVHHFDKRREPLSALPTVRQSLSVGLTNFPVLRG